jgi:hypothetical protein
MGWARPDLLVLSNASVAVVREGHASLRLNGALTTAPERRDAYFVPDKQPFD